MNEDMSVSVIVPVRNRRELLREALSSVVGQTRPAQEIIVVDDGSTDGSAEVAESLGGTVRVIRQEGLGRSSARNLGIENASGDFVAFLDSDDVWDPQKLERQIKLFSDDGVAMVAGHVWAIDIMGKVMPDVTTKTRCSVDRLRLAGCSPVAMIRRPGIYTSSIVVRTDVVRALGGFDEEMDGNEDWDLWIRLARASSIQVAPWPPLAYYRVHAGNTDSIAMAKGTLRMADRHLALKPHVGHDASSLLLVHRARAQATLGDRAASLRSLRRAFRIAPLAAARGGGGRLVLGGYAAALSAAAKRLVGAA